MLVNGGPCTPSLTVGELEPLHPLLFAHFLGAPEQKQNIGIFKALRRYFSTDSLMCTYGGMVVDGSLLD